MSHIRQERKSCETCRARKLRCSGDKTGCSRCKSLSLPCKFKDKGAPGRPRKRLRQEPAGIESLARRERTASSSSSQLSSLLPESSIISQEAVDLLSGSSDLDALTCGLSANCGFDTFSRETLTNGSLCSLPLELWQMSRSSELELHNGGLPLMPRESPVLPPAVSMPRSCKCDEEVSSIVRNLTQTSMSHDIVITLRTGVSLSERLLHCPVCYDVSKPPRVTVQNVLLIGHLMLEVTSCYQKYLRWLKSDSSEDSSMSENHTIYLDSGLGFPSQMSLQISGERLRGLILEGLQTDVERLLILGDNFALRQRNRHMAGHETCPDTEGRCRRREYGVDHDPLDVCPHNAVARKLIPCFRIVDEVREMIKQVADAAA